MDEPVIQPIDFIENDQMKDFKIKIDSIVKSWIKLEQVKQILVHKEIGVQEKIIIIISILRWRFNLIKIRL